MLGTLEGILIALITSMATILYGTTQPQIYIVGRKLGTDVFRPLEAHPNDETFPGLLMLRIEGVLYFANVSHVLDEITRFIQQHDPEVIVIDCSAINVFEYTALKRLHEFDSKLKTVGVELWIADLTREVYAAVSKSHFGQGLYPDRMHFNLEQAVEAYQQASKNYSSPIQE